VSKLKKFYILGSVGVDVVVGPIDSCPNWGHEVVVPYSSVRLSGAAGNSALILAKLGADVKLLTVLGNDQLGRIYKEMYENLGVDTDNVKIIVGRTSLSVGFKEEKGERFFLTNLGVTGAADFSSLFDTKGIKDSVVLICGVNLIPSMWKDEFVNVVEELSKDNLVALDTGCPKPEDWEEFREVVKKLLKHVHIFLPNEEEFISFNDTSTLEKAIEKYRKNEYPTAIVKLGPKGAAIVSKDLFKTIPTIPIKGGLEDTVGAGDSFNAGFLFHFVKDNTLSLESSVVFASKIAAEWIKGSYWKEITLL